MDTREPRALYLEVVFAMYSKPMTEHIPGDHHVGLHAVHSQAVHAQELWQEGIAMTLHYELEWRTGREGRLRSRKALGRTRPLPDRDVL